MRKKNYKKIIIALICLFLIFILLLFFTKNLDSTEYTVDVNFSGNDTIKLKNILAITDDLGKKLTGNGTKDGVQGFLEITLSNASQNNLNYEIYLQKNKSANEIDNNYIKVYLTDENDNPLKGFDQNVIPSYKSLKVETKAPMNKILYCGKIDKNEKKKIKLRMWLSDSSPIDKNEQDFSVKVGVKADR